MTLFTEVNDDAMTVDVADVATGPRVGFMEGFAASWEDQVRTSSQYAIENALGDMNAAQTEAMRKAGIENIPTLADENIMIDGQQVAVGSSGYLETAKFYEDGGDEDQAARFKKFDDRIAELQKQYPGLNLKSSRDLWNETREAARAASERAERQRATISGEIGAFVGGAIASMRPDTDPLNFATLGVGGIGKTAVARIATEAGAQGIVEGLNQLTGVQEERRLLGLSHGAGDALMRVGSTMLGGAAIQGVGEGAVALGKRFFRNIPSDPAPPPPQQLLLEYKPKNEADAQTEASAIDLAAGGSYTPQLYPLSPLHGSRLARQRTALDIDYVESRLQAWDGDEPTFIAPRTATAIPQPVSPYVSLDIELKGAGKKTLDEMAREVDPETFRIFDRLASEKQTYKQWIEDLRPTEQKALSKLQDMSDEIDDLKDLMARSGAKAQKKQQVKLDELMSARAAAADKIMKTDTPEMRVLRDRVIANDQKMRDMAPVVSRAYAHAQNTWDLGEADRQLVRQMVREGRTDIPKPDKPVLNDTYENTLQLFNRTMTEKVPLLRDAASVADTMREGSDAADFVTAIVKKQMETLDKGLEQYRATIDSVLSDKGDGTVHIMGSEYKFDLDKDTLAVPHEDGTGGKIVTMRELLEDNADTEADLKAVSSCSIK